MSEGCSFVDDSVYDCEGRLRELYFAEEFVELLLQTLFVGSHSLFRVLIYDYCSSEFLLETQVVFAAVHFFHLIPSHQLSQHI